MLTLLYATPLLFDLPKATLGIIVIFAVIPLIKIKKMKSLYESNKEKNCLLDYIFKYTIIPNLVYRVIFRNQYSYMDRYNIWIFVIIDN